MACASLWLTLPLAQLLRATPVGVSKKVISSHMRVSYSSQKAPINITKLPGGELREEGGIKLANWREYSTRLTRPL